jgi:hypothetical protein
MVTTDHFINTLNAIATEEKGVIIAPVDVPQPVGMPVESQQSTEPRGIEAVDDNHDEAKITPSTKPQLEQEKTYGNVPELTNQGPEEEESEQEDDDKEENST